MWLTVGLRSWRSPWNLVSWTPGAVYRIKPVEEHPCLQVWQGMCALHGGEEWCDPQVRTGCPGSLSLVHTPFLPSPALCAVLEGDRAKDFFTGLMGEEVSVIYQTFGLLQ